MGAAVWYNTGFTLVMLMLQALAIGTVRFAPQHVQQSDGPASSDGKDGPASSDGKEASTQPAAIVRQILSFDRISYSVDLPGRKQRGKFGKKLLNEVSGIARPGTMTALMGSSGAGKTTLLDVLANRKTEGKVTGTKLVNGRKVHAGQFSRMSAITI